MKLRTDIFDGERGLGNNSVQYWMKLLSLQKMRKNKIS